jgi:hypothetical protein
MTGLIVALLAFRPEMRNDPGIAQAQAESDPSGEKQADGGKTKTPTPPRDPDLRTRLALRQATSIDFTETGLRTALATLGEQHAVQHYIDQRSLRDAGVDSDAAVTLNLDNVPFSMVLDLMLRELSLGYRIRNGVIVIASEEDVRSQTEVRVYEVPEEDAQSLLWLIAETIEPDSWRPDPQVRPGNNPYGYGAAAPQGGFGGVADPSGPGSIRAYRGVLVVSQTPEVHQKIEKLLSDLNRVLIDRPRRGAAGAAEPSGLGDSRGSPGIPTIGYPGQPSTSGTTPPGYGSPHSRIPGRRPAGQPPTSGGFAPVPGSPAATPGLPSPATGVPARLDPHNEPPPNTPPTFERPSGSEAPYSPSAGAPDVR